MVYEKEVYLLLGGNGGKSTRKAFQYAHDFLLKSCYPILKVSKIYISPSWGYESKSLYYNQIIVFRSNEPPQKVLEKLLREERRLGRVRSETNRYTDRLIDMDLLYFGQDIVDSKQLTIPHPRLHLRRFTLLPLNEIAPDFVHPVLKVTNKELLHACVDDSKVTIEE